MYQDIINQSLRQRRIIKDDDLQFSHIGGPDFMGCNAWVYAVDLSSFSGRLEQLYDPKVLHQISTNAGGLKVSFANTQGFAYIVKLERVSALEPVDLLKVCQEPDEDGQPFDLWIYGPKGSGKSSLLQFIASDDINAGRRVIIADPKPAHENDWSGATVYGNGYKFDEIEAAIAEAEAALHRYAQTGQQARLTLVLDEWWNIKRNLPEAVDRVFGLVTIARTADIRVIVGTHSDRVKGAGVEGQGDLMLNFNIKVILTRTRTARLAEVDFGTGPQPARHPGPFISRRPAVIDATPGEALTEAERQLILFACRHNSGSFAVSALHEEIKRRLPEAEWSAGGPLTHHKVRVMLEDFERRGLLETVNGRRQPTRKLWKLL